MPCKMNWRHKVLNVINFSFYVVSHLLLYFVVFWHSLILLIISKYHIRREVFYYGTKFNNIVINRLKNTSAWACYKCMTGSTENGIPSYMDTLHRLLTCHWSCQIIWCLLSLHNSFQNYFDSCMVQPVGRTPGIG